MAVKIRLNKASLRFDEQLVRQICGNTVRTERLVRAFEKSPVPREISGSIQERLNALHDALMWVFSGGVQIGGPIQALAAPGGTVRLQQPWRPLSEEYAKRKTGPSFWRETGELQAFMASQLSQLAGAGAIRKVEVKAGKVKRGAKTVRASVLVTPVRLPEPLQTLVMYPFLQGQWVRLSANGTDGNEAKLLANSLLRGFMPDIATEYGLRALDSIKS